jgi:hypothetical protein
MNPAPHTSPVIYREVVGVPGWRVGNDGSVWSRRRSGTPNGGFLSDEWRRLKPFPATRTGHMRLHLKSRREGHRGFFVHRIVLETFVGPCPDGMESCHRDGNPANNAVENLYWGTRAQNTLDKITHGRSGKGEQNPDAKLTESEVRSIRVEHSAGATIAGLARKHHVSESAIRFVVKRRRWTHVA